MIDGRMIKRRLKSLAREVAPITSQAEAREVLGPPLHRAVLIRVHPVELLPLFHRVNPWLKTAEIKR
jgi:hypothetical protein